MRALRRAEASERDDLPTHGIAERGDARANRLPVEMDAAGAALGEAAAEMRIVQPEVVAQRIEQGHVRLGLYGVDLAVDVERKFLAHGGVASRRRARRSLWAALD